MEKRCQTLLFQNHKIKLQQQFHCKGHFYLPDVKFNVIVFYPQLIIGDFSLSYEQSKAQFAMWSIMASVSRLGVQMDYTLSQTVFTVTALFN